ASPLSPSSRVPSSSGAGGAVVVVGGTVVVGSTVVVVGVVEVVDEVVVSTSTRPSPAVSGPGTLGDGPHAAEMPTATREAAPMTAATSRRRSSDTRGMRGTVSLLLVRRRAVQRRDGPGRHAAVAPAPPARPARRDGVPLS